MIRDARGDQQVIRRATQQALRAWFRQSERLNIARREYKLNGPRFVDFARRIGITDKTSAYQLVHLYRYRADHQPVCRRRCCCGQARADIPLSRLGDRLGWFHQAGRVQRSGRYWLTPPALWRRLDAEFHFDHDPCPYPLPKGFNSLVRDWGQSNYVNPPFRKSDVAGGKGGLTAFVRKAISERKKGKTSVLVLPVFSYITLLLEAGAEIRSLGRVPFRDVDNHRPAPDPANVACFILRPVKPGLSDPER